MEEQRHQIALLHANDENHTQLNELLSGERFEVVAYDDFGSLMENPGEAGKSSSYSNSTFAVLVCARENRAVTDEQTPAYCIKNELEQLKGRFRRIMVLACSMDEETVCKYLAAGAHHVIPMEDTPRLMQARLQAGLREHVEPTTQDWHIGPYRFDFARRVVTMDDRPLGLSPREFEFARFLFEHRERIVPISELLQTVWSLPDTEDARRIDTAACRLRKKMMLNGNSAWHLRRIRRDGYQLTNIGDTH